jgi:hypothetical protein
MEQKETKREMTVDEKYHFRVNSRIVKEIQNLKHSQQSLREAINRITLMVATQRREIEVRCYTGWNPEGGCGRKFKVKDLTYIQTLYYRDDDWHEGEGQFKCPHCGVINRLYNRLHIYDLKEYFKEVEKKYDR